MYNKNSYIIQELDSEPKWKFYAFYIDADGKEHYHQYGRTAKEAIDLVFRVIRERDEREKAQKEGTPWVSSAWEYPADHPVVRKHREDMHQLMVDSGMWPPKGGVLPSPGKRPLIKTKK